MAEDVACRRTGARHPDLSVRIACTQGPAPTGSHGQPRACEACPDARPDTQRHDGSRTTHRRNGPRRPTAPQRPCRDDQRHDCRDLPIRSRPGPGVWLHRRGRLASVRSPGWPTARPDGSPPAAGRPQADARPDHAESAAARSRCCSSRAPLARPLATPRRGVSRGSPTCTCWLTASPARAKSW
jgi:hypothetical protein